MKVQQRDSDTMKRYSSRSYTDRSSYSPPIRSYRSRSRSRSPVRHSRPSPDRRRRLDSDRRDKLRSRTSGSSRRSHSSEMRPNEGKKPLYRGPDDRESINKAKNEPFRIVIVSKKEDTKRSQDILDRSHYSSRGSEDRKDTDRKRYVYLEKGRSGGSRIAARSNRRSPRGRSTSSNEKRLTPARSKYGHQDHSLNHHARDPDKGHSSRSKDVNGYEEGKRRRTSYTDKTYSDRRRSHSAQKRDRSRERRHHEQHDDRKSSRHTRERRRSDDYVGANEQKYNETQNGTIREDNINSYSQEQEGDSNVAGTDVTHTNGSSLIVRTPHVGSIFRPPVPTWPLPPPFVIRPMPIPLPRPPGFIHRPFVARFIRPPLPPYLLPSPRFLPPPIP